MTRRTKRQRRERIQEVEFVCEIDVRSVKCMITAQGSGSIIGDCLRELKTQTALAVFSLSAQRWARALFKRSSCFDRYCHTAHGFDSSKVLTFYSKSSVDERAHQCAVRRHGGRNRRPVGVFLGITLRKLTSLLLCSFERFDRLSAGRSNSLKRDCFFSWSKDVTFRVCESNRKVGRLSECPCVPPRTCGGHMLCSMCESHCNPYVWC